MKRSPSASLEYLLGQAPKRCNGEAERQSEEEGARRKGVPQPCTPPELIRYAERMRTNRYSDQKFQQQEASTEATPNMKTEQEPQIISTPQLHVLDDGSISHWQRPIIQHFQPIIEQMHRRGLKFTPVQESLGVGMGSCVIGPQAISYFFKLRHVFLTLVTYACRCDHMRVCALEAVGMPVDIAGACDKKPLSRQWMRAGRSSLFRNIRCCYKDIRDMSARAGDCTFHRRMCHLKAEPYNSTTGLSCTPFSTLRGDRSSVPAQEHDEFTMVVEFVSYVKRSKTKGGIVENVMNFAAKIKDSHFRAAPYCKTKPSSWASWLCQELKALGYSVLTLRLDNIYWNGVPRERRISIFFYLDLKQFSFCECRCHVTRCCVIVGYTSFS